jgi:hypothetical protein
MKFQTANLQLPKRAWTKEEILDQVTQEQVLERLGLPINEIHGQQSCKFQSPLREDRKADCRLRYADNGMLWFHDPGHGLNLDWIGCVRYARDCSFPEALQWIADAFGLEPGKEPSAEALAIRKLNAERPPAKPSVIQIKARSWNKADLGYWSMGNIGERELLLGRVWPISDYWLNGQHRRASAMSYAYLEEDGIKLYFTQERGPYRFLSTTKALSCYELLPQRGDLLVITSSKKDALTLLSFGYHAVAPQGEGMDIPAHLLWELKQRFAHQVLLYDNDYPGLKLAHLKTQKWGVTDFVYFPLEEDAKDPYAYCCKYGAATAAETFKNLLTPHARLLHA